MLTRPLQCLLAYQNTENDDWENDFGKLHIT